MYIISNSNVYYFEFMSLKHILITTRKNISIIYRFTLIMCIARIQGI